MSGRSPRRLAPRKSLHEGLSLWSATPRRTVRTHQLRGSDAFEIVIVGGGISGAISALVLTLAGHDVAIVDRRPPGDGSTLASTAMIQFEIDTPLIKLRDKIGRDKADRAYLRSAKAVRDLIALIADRNLASSWIEREAI